MSYSKNILLSLSVLGLYILTSCAPAVEITSDWVNSDARPTGNFDKILTVAMMSNIQLKTSFENSMETQLEKAGVQAVSASTVFDKNDLDREAMADKINSSGSQAILTMSILRENTEAQYVPARGGAYNPLMYNYYSGFYNYYGYYGPMVYDPGYVAVTNIYYLEANLYDVETDKLLYSSQSKVYDPSEIERFANSFSEEIVEALQAENLLSSDNMSVQIK